MAQSQWRRRSIGVRGYSSRRPGGSARRSAAREARAAPDRRARRRHARRRAAAAAGIPRLSEATEGCRVDVWLWRARFFKTRSLAARVIEEGGVRLSRAGSRAPMDKPSRTVRCGDVLAFPQGPRWLAVRVEALGVSRGPAPEARMLYSRSMTSEPSPPTLSRKRKRVATLREKSSAPGLTVARGTRGRIGFGRKPFALPGRSTGGGPDRRN